MLLINRSIGVQAVFEQLISILLLVLSMTVFACSMCLAVLKRSSACPPPFCLVRYYVSPVCFGCLLAPMLMLEAPRLLDASVWSRVGPGLLFFSAVLAFALNLSVLLFIGKTSALVSWHWSA